METGNDARGHRGARVAYVCLSLCVAVAAIATLMALAGSSAFAQEIVASINGDPITNIDIDERMKMLRVLRKPATRDAAIESLFADRLEIHEADKFGVDPRDSDISQQIVKVAQDMKLSPDALVEALQHAGVTPDHFKAHFRADLAFNVLVQALNKGVEASEGQVRAELAKQGGKAASGTAYTVRQIIFAIPHATTVATLTERAHEAEQLRARFTDCDSGLPLVRAMNDVTVRDPVVLTATLPRFLLNGDHGTMSFDLDNVEGTPGDYTINVKTSGPVRITGNPDTFRRMSRPTANAVSRNCGREP